MTRGDEAAMSLNVVVDGGYPLTVTINRESQYLPTYRPQVVNHGTYVVELGAREVLPAVHDLQSDAQQLRTGLFEGEIEFFRFAP